MKGLALTAVLIATASQGQTVDKVHDAVEAIEAQVKRLVLSYENLQGMAVGQDREVICSITNTVNTFRGGASGPLHL